MPGVKGWWDANEKMIGKYSFCSAKQSNSNKRMKSCRHKCQSGPSQSRHPQIQQTAARRTDEASFPENTEFSSDNYTRRSEEEVSPTRQTQLNEGADSTRTSMKSRHGRRSHLSDAMWARLGPQAPGMEKQPCISETPKARLGPPSAVVMSEWPS